MTLAWVALVALSAAPQVSFEDAVSKALANHPSLKMATADVARAGALVEQARAPSLPGLSANAIYTRLEGDRLSGDRVVAAANQVTANVQLQIPLVVPNRWAAWSRAGANEDAVKAGSLDVRRQVALTAARAWLSVLGQQRVVQAQQRGVDVSQAHLTYAEERKAGGIGGSLDVLRGAQELAVARTQLISAQAQLERLQEQLGVAVGEDGALDASSSEPQLKPVPASDAPERTDVLAAKARVDAATKATSWDWSDYTPLLTAVVQPGIQAPPTLTLPLLNFQAQLVLSIPLYDGGLRYGQEKERRALLSQAQAQLEQAARQAKSEVRTALVQVSRADETLAAAKDAASKSNEALSMTQAAFRAGGANSLEVIDAERRARDAETTVALAENAARQARLEALAASGAFP